jgi:hypothetical protein
MKSSEPDECLVHCSECNAYLYAISRFEPKARGQNAILVNCQRRAGSSTFRRTTRTALRARMKQFGAIARVRPFILLALRRRRQNTPSRRPRTSFGKSALRLEPPSARPLLPTRRYSAARNSGPAIRDSPRLAPILLRPPPPIALPSSSRRPARQRRSKPSLSQQPRDRQPQIPSPSLKSMRRRSSPAASQSEIFASISSI